MMRSIQALAALAVLATPATAQVPPGVPVVTVPRLKESDGPTALSRWTGSHTRFGGTVLADRPAAIARYFDARADCRPGGVRITVASPPAHGKISFVPGRALFASPRLNWTSDDPSNTCRDKPVAILDIVYAPDPGFLGEDNLVLEIADGDDTYQSKVGVAVVKNFGDDPPPPPEIGALTLPTGRLRLLGVGGPGAIFLDLEHSRRTGDIAEVRLFEVRGSPPAMPGKVLQQVELWRLDCVRRTRTTLGAQVFGENGKQVIWLPEEPPEPIVPRTGYESVALAACGERVPTPEVIVTGSDAAMKLGRTLLAAHGG